MIMRGSFGLLVDILGGCPLVVVMLLPALAESLHLFLRRARVLLASVHSLTGLASWILTSSLHALQSFFS